MDFAHDTEAALVAIAALVNTRRAEPDPLSDRAAFDAWLVDFPYSGVHLGTDGELTAVRRVRERVRGFWEAADRDGCVALVNELLAEAGTRPYLARHDGWDWHLHVTPPDAPLAHRIGAEAAMAVVDLVRGDELGRLRRCAGEGCEAVLVDLSRNRSRRFCDTGNCANRAHVAAYRARRAAQG